MLVYRLIIAHSNQICIKAAFTTFIRLPSPMPLMTNTELRDKSERFYVGDVHGPESLAVFEGRIFKHILDIKLF